MDKLIAHRGSHQKYKENTIEAFKVAISESYLGFECDVRQTKDKLFVINHDLLYKGKIISNTKYKELNLSSLKDVLNLKTDKIIMLDLKDPFLDTTKLLKIINKYTYLNLYIMSFYSNLIKKLDNSNRFYKLGIINNFNDTYDFLCLYHPLVSSKLLNNSKIHNHLLFIYGLKTKDIKDKYPYYIVDENVNK